MEIFGIGPLEVAFILILVLIIFGPKDLVKAGRTIGKALNKFVRSDTWKTINQTTQELRNLPTRLMRDSGLDEIQQAAREAGLKTENTIRPPAKPGESASTTSVMIQTPENYPEVEPPASSPEPAGPPPGPVKPPDKDSPA